MPTHLKPGPPLSRTAAIALALSSASCATVPPACPSLPEPPAPVQAEPNFLNRMQDFLSGKLPEPMSSPSPSAPAKPANAPPSKP